MNIHEAWRQIRGTAAEKVLLNSHSAGEPCFRSVYGAGVTDERSAVAAAQQLRAMGLAVRENSMAGELELTGEGKELAEMVVRSRENGPERWENVQRAMLRFVADTSPGRAFEILDSTHALVDGRAITQAEAEMALDFLTSNGLLQTIRTDQADDLRPRVTNNGMYAMHEPNIRDYVERGFVSVSNDYSTNTNVSGGTVGAVVGGQGNTTSVAQNISRDERTQVLALVDRVLSGLNDSVEDASLRSKVHEIKAEAEGPGTSKAGILSKARDALLLASATEGGRSVIKWIGQIISSLGG